MMLCLLCNGHSIIEAAQIVEGELELEKGMGLQLFKHLVLNGDVRVNLDCPLELSARRATF
jgi:hypothetical protein